MIEYLYNTIRATAGDIMTVNAILTDASGNDITEGCHFMLFNLNDELLITVDGEYKDGEWTFNVPTTGFEKGRYWYCICHNEEKLCFKQRAYLV